MNFKRRACSVCLSIILICGGVLPVQADYITFGNGAGSKWGDRNFGTASGVITWSFMNEGTTLSAGHPLITEVNGGAGAGSSLNSLRSSFDLAYGASSFDNAILNAFNTWSAASPGRIVFQQVADNGAIAGDNSLPASSAIDIRIGGFHSVAASGFSFVGAVGYGPPGDAINFPDPLAGDILINLDSLFIQAAGGEDDVFYDGITYRNDLEGLVLHELGHAAIGLGHSTDGPNAAGLGDVMYVNDFPNCCSFINRQLSAQDIAGARSVYGAVPEPSSSWALMLVAVFMLWQRRYPWKIGSCR